MSESPCLAVLTQWDKRFDKEELSLSHDQKHFCFNLMHLIAESKYSENLVIICAVKCGFNCRVVRRSRKK